MSRRRSRIQKLLPIMMRWREPDHPPPTRVIRAGASSSPAPFFGGQPWASSGADDRPFDFCASLHRLLDDISLRCPDFRHVQAPRILVTVAQTHRATPYGLQARVTPLRFTHGALTRVRRGITYHIQRYFLNDFEFLYLMTFYLPRFLNQTFDEKFITVFHELQHIHPAFNGDLRRHEGRYHLHTHCQNDYDKNMMHHAREYLAQRPDPGLIDFLRLDFAQIQARHGSVTGIVVPRAKIIPLVGAYASAANITSMPPGGALP